MAELLTSMAKYAFIILIVFYTYFHFASDRELTEAMLMSGAVCLAYETVRLPDNSLPLLVPMSEVAGRMAAINGAYYLQRTKGGNGMFICTVAEARVMTDAETMTYTYYQKNVKPKPQTEGKKGFVCKVCGWIYEGEELPDDIVCPLCKHGAADFEPIG